MDAYSPPESQPDIVVRCLRVRSAFHDQTLKPKGSRTRCFPSLFTGHVSVDVIISANAEAAKCFCHVYDQKTQSRLQLTVDDQQYALTYRESERSVWSYRCE